MWKSSVNCLTGFVKTLSSFFYIFEIYVQSFLRNTLLQILLIESGFNLLIEFKVYSNSHDIKTSKLICIANYLTDFRLIQVSTERNFRSELCLQNTILKIFNWWLLLAKLFREYSFASSHVKITLLISNYYTITVRRSSYLLSMWLQFLLLINWHVVSVWYRYSQDYVT